MSDFPIFFAAALLFVWAMSNVNIKIDIRRSNKTEAHYAEITNRLAKCEAHANSWHVRKVPTAGERVFGEK